MVDAPSVAVLRMEGTNCEQDIARAFAAAGAHSELVHINQITKGRVARTREVSLSDHDILAIPGGFSAGDYVRAGAIFAARLRASASRELDHFHEERKPILGICNGFQVLVELGLLPGVTAARTGRPEAVLTNNTSDRYECRPTLVRAEPGVCRYTKDMDTDAAVMFPSAHAEGRLLCAPPIDERSLTKAGQVVFRYTTPTSEAPAFPWNPNGSPGDVAGITDRTGTVLGLMPHPERALYGWQHPDWTRGRDPNARGDGLALFEAIVKAAR